MPSHKILVIDGDAASRNFIARILHAEGHSVLLAPSGKRGLITAWRELPELIIADPLLTDITGEELAARLRADARTARVPLVALSHNARTARLKAWLESGFDDYLVKSAQVVPLLRASISDLLGDTPHVEEGGGLLIPFLSAKGGMGTSSLCANLAMNIAVNEPDKRILVADLVLPMGSMSEIVGYLGNQDLVGFATKTSAQGTTATLRRSLPRIDAWGFTLLPGSPDPLRGIQLNVVRSTKLISSLKKAYDFVLLDLGRNLSRISLPLIDRADLIVIVANSDRDTVRLTRTLWDFLQRRAIQPSTAFLMLNRVVQVEGLAREQIEQAVGLPVMAAMPYLGSNLSLANAWHQPFSIKFPAEPSTYALKRAAQDIVQAARRFRAR